MKHIALLALRKSITHTHLGSILHPNCSDSRRFVRHRENVFCFSIAYASRTKISRIRIQNSTTKRESGKDERIICLHTIVQNLTISREEWTGLRLKDKKGTRVLIISTYINGLATSLLAFGHSPGRQLFTRTLTVTRSETDDHSLSNQ